MFLAQIAAPPSGAIESWLLSAAAIASMALLAKKLFSRKPPGHADLATQTDLFREVTSLRDKIDARFLTLSEKIEHLGTSIHDRLNQLEAGLARVDERTKL